VESDPTQERPAPSEGPEKPPISGGTPAATLESSRIQATPATLDFALLRGALEEIPFGVATTREGRIRYANEALARMLGAQQGKLEQKELAQLFDPETFARVSASLDAQRSFDGRVRARCPGGREIDVELHVEQYSSEAQGSGGFVIMRDITLERGALARIVDQLGGALFRLRVGDGRFEWVSPAIAKLTGLDASVCTMHPVVLTKLVSDDERERLLFLYRRMAKAELPVATAQVSVRRPDGTIRVVQIRATGRRDTSGRVQHIDGVVIDAARDPDAAGASPPISVRGVRLEGAQGGDSASPIQAGTMELSHELLREASQHLHAIGRELRALRQLARGQAGREGVPPLPKEIAADLSTRVDALTHEAAATAALNRGVRRALASETMGAPLVELLENVRATLAPVVGSKALAVEAGDGGDLVIQERVQELTLALTHLGLRAYRFAGSGSLRFVARRVPALAAVGRALATRPPPDRSDVLVEIIGTAPTDLAETAMEISSDLVRTIPRPADADLAFTAAQTLIAGAGGVIEIDDAGFTTARSTVRLRGG
jgi:PAS domain S-box-containing protein